MRQREEDEPSKWTRVRHRPPRGVNDASVVCHRLRIGGDPAAGSPTATLLRLHPSYQSDLRRLLPEGSADDFWSN